MKIIIGSSSSPFTFINSNPLADARAELDMLLGASKRRGRGRPIGKSTKRERVLKALAAGKQSNVTVAAKFWPDLEMRMALARLATFRNRYKRELKDLIAQSKFPSLRKRRNIT
jgi:hypothetical protein